MFAYVLAAGLGTRLRPLTNVTCKPLVEVCGTPLIHFALKLLEGAGVTDVGINSHWLHPQLPTTLGSRFGKLRLTYTHEPDVLGTGGGLRGLTKALPPTGRVIVMNADALIDLDMRALVAMPDDALATLVLKSVPDAASYGIIGTDASERITTFAGRIEPLGPVVKERMFCGVHYVDPKAFDVLPDVEITRAPGDVAATARGPQSGVNDEGYPVWLKRGALLRGFDMTGTFCDVGTPERLLEANLSVLAGTWSSAHLRPFDGMVARGNRVYVAPAATVEGELVGPAVVCAGARVEHGSLVQGSVIGPRSTVGRGARVVDSVLQSGSRVDGERNRAILWQEGATTAEWRA